MPLPTNPKTAWPPIPRKRVDLFREMAAWYSADMVALSDLYERRLQNGTPETTHWGRQVKKEVQVTVHVPLATDISKVSAALLFGEHPTIRIPDAGDNTDAEDTQKRLDYIVEKTETYNKLIEAADIGSGLGGIYLKVSWDAKLADHPILEIVQPDQAAPEFKYGIMTAATFWKTLAVDGNKVWRLLERHEPGQILTGLYLGTDHELGASVDLSKRPETETTLPVVYLPDALKNSLACVYIPNLLPNRRDRGSYLGQSDYAEAVPLMDSLDTVYTSWIRDIRLGQGRILAPREFFEADPSDDQPTFNLDRAAYVALDVPPGEWTSMAQQITVAQFAIRMEEHRSTAVNLVESIVSAAGYNSQSFGLNIQGNAESGTALNFRERKSIRTTGQKSEYWRPRLKHILWVMLVIDAMQLGSGIQPISPDVELADPAGIDIRQRAETVEMINRAQAASVETRVRMLHPDRNETWIQAEVKRILDEQGMAVPDPLETGLVG
jgi:A118 family predicted phage portal protein